MSNQNSIKKICFLMFRPQYPRFLSSCFSVLTLLSVLGPSCMSKNQVISVKVAKYLIRLDLILIPLTISAYSHLKGSLLHRFNSVHLHNQHFLCNQCLYLHPN
jgi:hypothetical protein